MAGVKGRSGRNLDKPWADALRLCAFANDKNGKRKLARIAEACVDAAMNGDLGAIKEVGDRLDGKPEQTATLTVHRPVQELLDHEITARLLELRAIRGGNGAFGDDPEATDNPQQPN